MESHLPFTYFSYFFLPKVLISGQAEPTDFTECSALCLGPSGKTVSGSSTVMNENNQLVKEQN
jgi:hypothetical protein